MLSISNLSSSDIASKYYCSGSYYMKGNDPDKEVIAEPEWYGKCAKYLNLSGFVEEGKFNDALSGIVKDHAGRVTTQLGRNENGIIKHAPGIDMTFSAPKSVSIMAEVAGDERLIDAHIKSVKTSLEYFEKMVQTRKTKEGSMEYASTPNIVAALFTHGTSRSLDPQVHTHCVVSNIVYDQQDSKFRSAFLGSAFDSKMFLGQVYRSELAKQVNELGYTIEKTHKDGRFEIKGVSKELIEEFSKRRKQIENALESYEHKNAKTAAVAAVATRAHKKYMDINVVSEEWRKTTKEMGYDLTSIIGNATVKNNKTKQQEGFTPERIVRDTILHISERKSCFTKAEIIQESLSLGFGRVNLEDTEQNINKLKSEKLLLAGEYGLYTTKKAINLEQEVISLMEKGKGTTKTIISNEEYYKLNEGRRLNDVIDKNISHKPETPLEIMKTGGTIDKDLKMSTLNFSQKQTAEMILTNKDSVIGIQGYAGTGKTYMLSAVKEIAEAKGYKLQGFAPTASAAKTLKESSGIESDTLHKFLSKYDGYANNRGSKEGLEKVKEEYKNTIFVMDESSLAGTKQMKDLLTIIDKFESKIILVGDTKQLGSVEAGKPFHALQNAGMSVCIMSDIRRQEQEHIKQAVELSIKGNIAQSFEKLKDNITEIKSENSLANKNENNKSNLILSVKDKWLALTPKEKQNTLILTPANETRREINSIIREELQKNEKIQGNAFSVETLNNKGLTLAQKAYSVSYQKDDVVLFNKTYKSLGIKAGEYYKVHSTNGKDNKVFLKEYISYNNKTQEKEIINKDEPKGILSSIIDKISNATEHNHKKDKRQETDRTNTRNAQGFVEWDPNEKAGRRQGAIEVFEVENKELQSGDIIRWTKNDKMLGLINSDMAEIVKINKDTVDVRMKDGKIQNIFKDHHALKHLDYGYASTVHAAQGKTSDNVIAVVESYRKNLTTQQSFYVEISRAKNNVELIVDDKQKVIEQLSLMTGEKKEALEIIKNDNLEYNKQDSVEDLVKNLLENTYSSPIKERDEKIKVNELENSL
jgi:conjugative relaxase-like TrwC/TraI family protein